MFYEGVSYFIIHLLKYSISVYIIYSDNWPVRWWQGLEPMQWNLYLCQYRISILHFQVLVQPFLVFRYIKAQNIMENWNTQENC